MLQQTRVATATPYYHAFLERFPTLGSLARAREADVLAAWAGLGYYRRARQLREAARAVVREHGGRVPDEPAAFARLPGRRPLHGRGGALHRLRPRRCPRWTATWRACCRGSRALPAALREPGGARRCGRWPPRWSRRAGPATGTRR